MKAGMRELRKHEPDALVANLRIASYPHFPELSASSFAATERVAQTVCQRIDVEVDRVDDGRFGEVPWRRVFLADAAIEDDYFVVAPDFSSISQYGDGGEGGC